MKKEAIYTIKLLLKSLVLILGGGGASLFLTDTVYKYIRTLISAQNDALCLVAIPIRTLNSESK